MICLNVNRKLQKNFKGGKLAQVSHPDALPLLYSLLIIFFALFGIAYYTEFAHLFMLVLCRLQLRVAPPA